MDAARRRPKAVVFDLRLRLAQLAACNLRRPGGNQLSALSRLWSSPPLVESPSARFVVSGIIFVLFDLRINELFCFSSCAFNLGLVTSEFLLHLNAPLLVEPRASRELAVALALLDSCDVSRHVSLRPPLTTAASAARLADPPLTRSRIGLLLGINLKFELR